MISHILQIRTRKQTNEMTSQKTIIQCAKKKYIKSSNKFDQQLFMLYDKLDQDFYHRMVQEIILSYIIMPKEISNSQPTLSSNIQLAKHFITTHQYEQALSILQTTITTKESLSEIYNLKGVAYFKLEKFDKSRDMFNQSLKINSLNLWATSNWITTYIRQSENQEANIKKIQNALKPALKQIQGNDLQVNEILLSNLGYACWKTHKYRDKTEKLYKQSLEIMISESAGINYVALLIEEGRIAEAKSILYQTLKESRELEVELYRVIVEYCQQKYSPAYQKLKQSHIIFAKNVNDASASEYTQKFDQYLSRMISELSFNHNAPKLRDICVDIIKQLLKIIEASNMNKKLTNLKKINCQIIYLRQIVKGEQREINGSEHNIISRDIGIKQKEQIYLQQKNKKSQKKGLCPCF